MDRRKFIRNTVLFSLLSLATINGVKLYKNALSKNQNSEEKFLSYIEVHLADHCNLNCKYCCHFSPIAEEHFYDKKMFTKDMKQLAKITNGNIKEIRLMGGEPLLNPDINKYMKITRQLFSKSKIYLVTNGILLPKMDNAFWTTLRTNNIIINPSIYKINIDWHKIYKKANEENVVIFIPEDEIKNVEVTHFYKSNLDLTGSQKNLLKFIDCGEYYNLYEGKIYICPVVAYIKYFNKRFNKNLKPSNTDYVDIYKTKNIEDILNWSKQPKNFCKYCGDNKPLLPWESSMQHTIDEWLKTE